MARQEEVIRTCFEDANYTQYFGKNSHNISILSRILTLSYIEFALLKIRRTPKPEFLFDFGAWRSQPSTTLQERKVPKALKIQALEQVRITFSCLISHTAEKMSEKFFHGCVFSVNADFLVEKVAHFLKSEIFVQKILCRFIEDFLFCLFLITAAAS